MERWRSFFGSSGEDLWTVIDRALTIAATDYPQELRVRRDAIAEKLFAHPSSLRKCTFCLGQALPGPNLRDDMFLAANPHPPTSSIGEAPALTRSNGRIASSSPSEREQGQNIKFMSGCNDGVDVRATSNRNEQELSENSDELRLLHEVHTIKEQILDPNQTEATCLAALKVLEDMPLSVPILKATVIGKFVNELRRHSSRQVRTTVKRLISLWKDVVDKWVEKEGEAVANAYLDRVAYSGIANVLDTTKQVLSVHSELTDETRSMKLSCESKSFPRKQSATDQQNLNLDSRMENAGPVASAATDHKDPLENELGHPKNGSSSKELHQRHATSQRRLTKSSINVSHKSLAPSDKKLKLSENSMELRKAQTGKKRLHEFSQQQNDGKQQCFLKNPSNGPPFKLGT